MDKIAPDLKDLVVGIDTVHSHPSNPRRGDVPGIAESLNVNGQYAPIVVDLRNGNILAGNHTWKAAKSLGWDEIAVVHVEVDDQQAKRILLADNRTSDLATYDRGNLLGLIEQLSPDLEGSGWDKRSLERLYQMEEFDGEDDIFGGGGMEQSGDEATTKKIHVGKNLLLVEADYFNEWLGGIEEACGGKPEALLHLRDLLGLTDDPEPKPVVKGKKWKNISGETPRHVGLDALNWVAIDSVMPHPENARQGDIGAISESLRINGVYRPLLIQESSSLILKGNNTWQAARSLGWDEIPVTFIDVTDAEAARILLADNRLADKAGYYNASLASVLMDLDSLDGTGFEPADIEEIIKDLPQERDPIAAINAPADVRRVATIKVGGASIQVCGKQYSEWEQLMIADGFVSKEERGYRIGQLLTLDPSLFSVWASVADPTTGNNEFRK